MALPHAGGPVVVPVGVTPANGTFIARAPAPLLELADAAASSNATLVVDHASAWRASGMRGLMLRGPASVYVPSELTSGGRGLAELVGDTSDAAVRVRPRSAVWWVGWSSGTVTPS
jgi:hypothetical protein